MATRWYAYVTVTPNSWARNCGDFPSLDRAMRLRCWLGDRLAGIAFSRVDGCPNRCAHSADRAGPRRKAVDQAPVLELRQSLLKGLIHLPTLGELAGGTGPKLAEKAERGELEALDWRPLN